MPFSVFASPMQKFYVLKHFKFNLQFGRRFNHFLNSICKRDHKQYKCTIVHDGISVMLRNVIIQEW